MCRFKDALLILQKAELKVCDALHIPEHHWQAIAVRVLRQRWVENAIVGNLRGRKAIHPSGRGLARRNTSRHNTGHFPINYLEKVYFGV
jgi:hypothetical protein